jgi:hypothetical protein
MRNGNILFSAVSGLCVWKIPAPTSSIEQILRSKQLMHKELTLIAISAARGAAKKFDGKPDGIFVLKI